MKIFTKLMILALLVAASHTATWAQHSVSGIPGGMKVTVDDEEVTVTNGKTPAIEAGKTVRIINTSGKTLQSITAAKKTTVDIEEAVALCLVSKVKVDDDDFSSAKRLTATAKTRADGDDEEEGRGNVEGILSAIDASGVITPVKWDFELDEFINPLGDKEKAFINAASDKFVMSLPYIYTIGDKWLWMVKCNLEYNGNESAVQAIAEQCELTMTEVESLIDDLNVFIHKNRRHYLVRVSDGAIFPWKNAPEKQRGVKGNFMGAGDICGVVEPYGEESIVYINANRQIVLLNVAGGELQERVISPSDGEYTKAMFVAPTTEGYLGTVLTDDATLTANNYYGRGEACALTLDGEKKPIGYYDQYGLDDKPEGYEPTSEELARINDGKQLFALNGKLYFIEMLGSDAQFKEVSFDGANVAMNVKATINNAMTCPCMRYSFTGIAWPVFKSDNGTMTYGGGTYLNVFDPASNSVTKHSVPEHYPGDLHSYYDGVAYVLDGYSYEVIGSNAGCVYENSLPQRIWICDIHKDRAAALDVDWSGLSAADKAVTDYTDLHWFYWGGEQFFLAKAKLQDGRKVQYVIYVSGEKMGKAEILVPGETIITGTVSLNKN